MCRAPKASLFVGLPIGEEIFGRARGFVLFVIRDVEQRRECRRNVYAARRPTIVRARILGCRLVKATKFTAKAVREFDSIVFGDEGVAQRLLLLILEVLQQRLLGAAILDFLRRLEIGG